MYREVLGSSDIIAGEVGQGDQKEHADTNAKPGHTWRRM